MTPRVVLVGAAAVGKSAVGAALAARLGWPFLETGALLARASGRSRDELLAAEGAQAVARAESHALTMLLGLPGPYAAAVPLSLIEQPAERTRLRDADAVVVWLRASPATLTRRGASAADREQVERCATALEEAAHLVVDTDRLAPPQVVRDIRLFLGRP